jgi:LuxR family maltose regulon positive regulatory protein
MPAAELFVAGIGLLEINAESRYGSVRRETAPGEEMAAANDEPLEPGRNYIIKRPRLTRLLDEATARIVMLVAPAGYGKTTLAREWLADRQHGWYRGTPAAADVAALAVGLARTASAVIPDAGTRMADRLRATGTPEKDVEPLAELLAEDLEEWPSDAWVAFDDYQFACASPFAERFVDLVLGLCPVRLFLTTRTRPSWATSRKLLYGEIFGIGRSELAMSPAEAREVLADRPGSEAQGLVALADGWPAVIGLAALTGDVELPEGDLPEALHTYFTEELYQAADPAVQEGLSRLALASMVSPEVAESLLDQDAERVVREGVRLGFFASSTHGTYEIHPLVRGFLEKKLREQPGAVRAVVPRLTRTLIERHEWDDAFSLLEQFFEQELFVGLVDAALYRLLLEARISTLTRWLELGAEHEAESPTLDLAEAELAFRDGDRDRAEALALQAARLFGIMHKHTTRALCLAGKSAHLNYRDDVALEHFGRGRESAQTAADQSEALWGEFVAVAALEKEDPTRILSELESSSSHSADDLFRLANGQIILGHLDGTLNTALDRVRLILPLSAKAKDPLIYSSFLNIYAASLTVAARYPEALTIADTEIEQAHRFRLTFVLPHAYANRAAALWGLRRFKPCRTALDQAERAASADDGFLVMSVGAIQARLHLAEGKIEEALAVIECHHHRLVTVGMEGEFLACWSLALACAGRPREAERTASKAESISQRAEVAGLVAWTRAINALRTESKDASSLTDRALQTATRIGNFDGLVTAYRAYPPLLDALVASTAALDLIRPVIVRARDQTLAARSGLRIPTAVLGQARESLSKREQEVFDLLARGLTNKEIASALYIAESTVKRHLQHIYEKLGVRSRTEAVLRASQESTDT